jgi:acetyl esterase/lipase
VVVVLKALRVAGVVVLAGLLAGCGTGPTATSTSTSRAYRDLAYCSGQKLDLFEPSRAPHPMPIAMFVHGGGMTAGSKASLNPVLLDALVSDGYAVASINYRLAPTSRFPAQIEDVKCAIRFLRHVAPAYALNVHQLVAFGTSVGGELVVLAALTDSTKSFDVGEFLSEPVSLSAVADFFGPANLSERASGFTLSGISAAFGSDPSGPMMASPTHYVRPDAPPILIVQGAEDSKVRASQAIELCRDLEGAHDRVELMMVQHMGHMFSHVGMMPMAPSMPAMAGAMVEFFDHALAR